VSYQGQCSTGSSPNPNPNSGPSRKVHLVLIFWGVCGTIVPGCSTAAVFFERLGDLDQIWTTRNRCESMWFFCCWFECRCCAELEKGKREVVVAHTTGATMTVTDCRMYEAPFPEVDDVVMVSVCTSLSLSFSFSFRLLLSIIKPVA